MLYALTTMAIGIYARKPACLDNSDLIQVQFSVYPFLFANIRKHPF